MPLALRVAVIHWEPMELPAKVRLVQQAGAEVVVQEGEDGHRAHEAVLRQRPDALVMWTTWKPAHSRMLAGAVRAAGARMPILFIDEPGAPTPKATLDGLRATVPDALFDVVDRLPFWLERIAARKDNLASVVADDKPHVARKDLA